MQNAKGAKHAYVHSCRPATLFCLTSVIFSADVISLHTLPMRTRVSGEIVHLANDEDMLVAGLHQDFFFNPRHLPGVYAGVGGYGAAAGERGGFFILGGSFGWQSPAWYDFRLDFGVFAGGGGGTRDTGQGDGLMLRGHGVAVYDLGPWAVRAGIAHTEFPGGNISSTAFTAGFTVDEHLTLVGGGNHLVQVEAVQQQRWSFAPVYYRYHLDSGTIGREGTELDRNLDILGIEIARHLNTNWRIPLLFGGALGGNRAGYMDVSSGAIYGIGSTLRIEARMLIGLGGGGSYRTGGGVLLRPEVALGYCPHHDWMLELRGGRLEAREGDFDAWVGGVAINWQPNHWHITDAVATPAAAIPADQARVDTWRIGVGSTTYFPTDEAQPSIDLVDLSLEKPITQYCALVGRTRSAYGGDAGSYSEGLFGLRLEWPWTAWCRSGFEADIGAGGGGGLDTGNGLVADLSFDVRVRFGQHWESHVGVGSFKALDGTFEAYMLSLGLVWDFSRAVVR